MEPTEIVISANLPQSHEKFKNIFDLLDAAVQYPSNEILRFVQAIFPEDLFGSVDQVLKERALFKGRDLYYYPGNIGNSYLWTHPFSGSKAKRIKGWLHFLKKGATQLKKDEYFFEHYHYEILSNFIRNYFPLLKGNSNYRKAFESKHSETIYFFEQSEREPFRIFIVNGLLCKLCFENDTVLMRAVNTDRDVETMCVLNCKGELYVMEKIPNLHQHSTITASHPVIFAGFIQISDGKIKKVINHSGHYLPTYTATRNFACYLHERNCDLADVTFEVKNRVATGLEEKAFKVDQFTSRQILANYKLKGFFIDRFPGFGQPFHHFPLSIIKTTLNYLANSDLEKIIASESKVDERCCPWYLSTIKEKFCFWSKAILYEREQEEKSKEHVFPELSERFRSALKATFFMTKDRVVKISKIKAGLSQFAEIYKVESDGEAYIVRMIDSKSSNQSAKVQEVYANLYASEMKVAPKIHYFNSENGVIVMDFITDHRAWMSSVSRFSLNQLSQMLKKMSSVSVGAPFKIKSFNMEKYCGITQTRSEFYARLVERYRKLDAELVEENATTLVNGELNPYNILFDGNRFWLIDFECSRRCSNFYDLATILLFNGITGEQELTIVSNFCKTITPELLQLYFKVKELVCLSYSILGIAVLRVPFRTLSQSEIAEIIPYQGIKYERDISGGSEGLLFNSMAFYKAADEAVQRREEIEETVRILASKK